MSKIIPIGRVFRERLELSHAPRSGDGDWRFAFEYVGAEGRRFIGSWADVADAFRIAVAFRNSGVRVVAIEGAEP